MEIDFSALDQEKIKDNIKEKFPWAQEDFIEEAIITAAIMINSTVLALKDGLADEAVTAYCNDLCKMQERFADIKFESAKEEREICAAICNEIYDQPLGNTCCRQILKMACTAIKSRNQPT